MEPNDAILIHGSAAEAEILDSSTSYHSCDCGKVITVSAGMMNTGDSLKIAGSTTACPSCGKAVNLN